MVHQAWITAKGGVLVLVPSFDDVHALSGALRVPGGVVLAQDHKKGVRGTRDTFLAYSRKGIRPVWVGTGGAWASLNLSDREKDPDEDFLLTDLVIPRIPFGLNRGSTYEVRRMKIGHGADVLDAYFLLRQGFGRLIRRKGVKHRRLWFLDARVEVNASYEVFRRLLDTYPKRECMAPVR